MASTYLTRTPSSGGTPTTQTFTLSFWIKKCAVGINQRWFGVYTSADLNTNMKFNTNDTFQFYNRNTSTGDKYFVTNRQFRDTSAWYHFVIAIDTTLSTEADRVKFYVNGVEETSFSENFEPPQNYEYRLGEAIETRIGIMEGSADYLNGALSHFHYIDGTQYSASDFGQYDANGVWTIKTSPSVTYGNNGFFILKDGNSVTDQSGNGNNFTVGGGTLTNTEDNPSNVFDTINANMSLTPGVAGRDSAVSLYLSNGNTRLATDVPYWTPVLGSIPMSSGKYYFEVLRKYEGSPSNHLAWVGIENIKTAGTNLGQPTGSNTDSIGFYSGDGGTNKSNSGTGNNYGSWTANNDIVMCAVDLDNNYIYFGVNGTWGNSCDPTSGSSGTGGISITAGTYVTGFTIHRGGGTAGGDKSWLSINFGNGYFQTTAVSSAGTNASGIGIFEYDVPTGYTALSTKGLNL